MLEFLGATRAHSIGFADTVAVILLAVAVAVITRLITALQARSAMLERLFEQAPPLALLNRSSQVIRVNGEFTRLFGYSPEEAGGRMLGDLIVPPESRAEFEEHARRLARGERVEVETVRRHKNGQRLHISVAAVAVAGPDAQIWIYAVYRDITLRRNAEIALQELSRRLIEVQEAERRSLARELHDEIGQLLTGLRLLLSPVRGGPLDEMTGRLGQAHEILDGLLARVRGLSFDLRPADLDQFGLLPALLALCDRFTAQSGILVDFKHQQIEQRFAPEVETGAYRVVQESLTNIARHAGVAGAAVRVWTEADHLHLRIEDRGAGFDAEGVMQRPRSSGLIGMRERIFVLGGRMNVESSPGCGTTIIAELPLVPDPKTAAPTTPLETQPGVSGA